MRVLQEETYSEELADLVEDVPEHKPLLLSTEPSVFSDAGYQLGRSKGGVTTQPHLTRTPRLPEPVPV